MVELLLRNPSEKESFSLTEVEVAQLPPAFLAHSSADQDVPVEASKVALSKIPNVTYEEVEKLPHDFDNDLTNSEGIRVYHALIEWLDNILATT